VPSITDTAAAKREAALAARREAAAKRAEARQAAEARQVAEAVSRDRVLLGYDDLRNWGVAYSRTHLWRLIGEGRFPKPVALSPGQFARKAWRRGDIEQWIANLPTFTGSDEAM
jgi:hypothetical protein